MRPRDEVARAKLRDAIVRGEIVVPGFCESCGAANRKCSDGRRSLQAHHPDHAKPLKVVWLCPKCHRAETPIPRGERNGAAKLSAEAVEAVRALHQTGKTYTEIAHQFDVDRRTISRAIHGVYWGTAREAKP